MNLIKLYDTLSKPESNNRTFNALPIPNYPFIRIAIDFDSNVVLLFSIAKNFKDFNLKNFRFKYLQIEQNIECKILENGKTRFQTFTVITFKNADKNLHEYFLRISEALIRAIGQMPTQQQVIDTFNKFVEIFSSLTDTPIKTINGLWAELFVIDSSKNPNILIDFWHNKPEEKFDFNAGNEKIEVKSCSTFERIHFFSSEQLNPPENSQVLIASLFLKQSNRGKNINDLVDSISHKLNYDGELTLKLKSLVCKTLGSSFEYSISLKFDSDIANESLQFYKHQDIVKIEKVNIPNNVTEVRFKSDLTNSKKINLKEIENKQKLFKAL